jgi:lipopolysaccharide transport system ATP-binding protein
MPSIDIEGVHVSFPIYHGNSRSLKRTMFAVASGRLHEDTHHRIVVQALRDVSLHLTSGDRLGLIGGNGAGKTTLLRTLAGIYEPVVGSVHVSGSIGALLDPNLGMNPELTGRENIALRGLYNGLSRPAIRRLEDDVQEFAELAEFLDLPVRFYSSGMVIRLGFALATAIRPQVLLMDEWLLAGDAAFMDKARSRLEEMVRGADILVLSSHSAPVILDWCTRVLWLDQGRVMADGASQDVMDRYLGKVTVPITPASSGSRFSRTDTAQLRVDN